MMAEMPASTLDDVLAGRAQWCVVHAESEAFLRTLPDACLDGAVLDPPYGLGTREPTVAEILAYLSGQATLDTGGDFMGKDWSLPPVSLWRELLRVLKPGAWIAVFGGTQTDDLLSIGLRAAGFERQDAIDVFGTSRLAWLQAQGMLKGLNIGKAIDEAAGLDRDVVGPGARHPSKAFGIGQEGEDDRRFAGGVPLATAPASPEAAHWDGFNTAVAPKHEPVLLFRKPLAQVTSEQLRGATGWDHWHSIRDLRRPEARVEAAARFGCDVPEKARVVTKRALHSGVTSRVELQAGDGWAALAVRDEEPYREWSTRTVAANVLVHGCGGVNVDATRIGTSKAVPASRAASQVRHMDSDGFGFGDENMGGTGANPNVGRMPNNVALIHCDECREVGTRTVRARPTSWDGQASTTHSVAFGAFASHGAAEPQSRGPSVDEAIPAWECLAGCPVCLATTVAPAGGAAPACECGAAMTWICCVAALDGQGVAAGVHSAGAARDKMMTRHYEASSYNMSGTTNMRRLGDDGGASRFFHVFSPDPREPFIYAAKAPAAERHAGGRNTHVAVKPVRKLLRHLWRLIMPPGGVGLDCFSGSGSGAAAGVAEGFRVVAVEQDAEHVETSLRRIPALLAMADGKSAKPASKAGAPKAETTPPPKLAPAQTSIFDRLDGAA